MLELFHLFLAKMRTSFRRIASASRNEKEVGDLHNDAYVLALDIGESRGRHIDFSDPDDQDLVMRALYVENVKRGDWKMRDAVRIDQESDDEDGGSKWYARLPAQASSDPLVSLLVREASHDPAMAVEASYSQAAAYIVTFDRFRNDRQQVCAHLAISAGTLWRRVAHAAETYRVQPSMFDHHERIPADFMPIAGRRYGTTAVEIREAGQWTWDFS